MIHTVGPVWRGGRKGEVRTLLYGYHNCLAVAASAGMKSIAFPAISTGAYGFPFVLACLVSLLAIRQFCELHVAKIEEVRLIYFSMADLQVAKAELSHEDSEW